MPLSEILKSKWSPQRKKEEFNRRMTYLEVHVKVKIINWT